MINIYWLLACITIGFSSGVYVEKKFNLAAQASSAYAALSNAQKGQMEIIADQQALEKNHEKNKDPCDNVILNPDDDRVLR